MIELAIALLIAGQSGGSAPSAGASDQAVKANLDSCAMEQGRWVCRYTVPDVEIIPFVGSPSEADPGPSEGDVAPPTLAPREVPVQPVQTAATATVAAPTLVEPSILTPEETRLMNRCAEAGVFSLCLPDDRRQARAFRERQTAYDATRRTVTGLIAEDRCDAAVRAALDGGYLALASQVRAFCTAPGPETVNVEVPTPEE